MSDVAEMVLQSQANISPRLVRLVRAGQPLQLRPTAVKRGLIGNGGFGFRLMKNREQRGKQQIIRMMKMPRSQRAFDYWA